MKYFHVIYNSSQKNIDGGTGFGFRTMTTGIPESFMQALRDNTNLDLFFTYKYGTYVYPSPSVLFNERNKVLEFPKGYSFSKVKLNNGGSFYLLERIIPVGFDYTYYLKNMPGRLGNYVVDCYIFPDIPSSEVFEMLYENPIEGSNYFIPKSPVPDQDNEEMKNLSLGSLQQLAQEEKPFSAQKDNKISDKAIELLFAYIEARKKNKKMIVKYSWKDASLVIADFTRLIPASEISNIAFCTNYHNEGIQEAFNIMFINEYYQYDIPSQAMIIDLNQDVVSTKERKLFRETIAEYITNGYTDLLHSLVSWLLSDTYALLDGKSDSTNKILYSYCIDRDKFVIKDLLDNDEAVKVLKVHISQDKTENRFLVSQLCMLFNSCISLKDYAYIIEKLNYLKNEGFDISEVVSRNRQKVTDFILQNPQNLATSIKAIKLPLLKEYIIKEEFEKKADYLKDNTLFEYWIDLYKYFYSDQKLKNKKEFLRNLFEIKLPDNTRKTVIKEQIEVQTLVHIYVELINENPEKVKTYGRCLIETIEENRLFEAVNMFEAFSSQIANDNFGELLFFQLSKMRCSSDPILQLKQLKEYMDKNSVLKAEVKKNFQKIPLYDNIYNAIKNSPVNNNKSLSTAESIEQFVLFLSDGISSQYSKWYILKFVLEQNVKDIAKYISQVYNLTIEMRSVEYFKKIVFKEYNKFDIEQKAKDMKNIGMTENEMLELVSEEIKDKKTSEDYKVCIYKVMGRDFKFIQSYLKDSNNKDSLLNKYYKNEYNSFKRKEKFKNMFRSFLSIFKRKQKK